MGWSSPRRDKEWARGHAEHIISLHEQSRGKPLSAKEVKEIHDETLEAALENGRRLRSET